MNKVIVSDLDGTLLNGRGQVSDYTADMVKKAVEQSNIFSIATGRTYEQTTLVRQAIGDEILCICCNGAIVYENGKVISKSPLKKHHLKELLDIDLCKYEKDIYINGFSQKDWLAIKEDKFMKQFSVANKVSYKVCSKEEFGEEECLKVFFASEHHELLEELRKEIVNKMPQLEVNFSCSSCLEVNEQGVSKYSALERFCISKGIDVKEVIAFGDGFNDYEMLLKVGNPCVMDNAPKALKEAISHGTIIESNKKDGVARYLKKEILV